MYKGPRGDGAWHLPEITCGLVVWGLEEGLTKGGGGDPEARLGWQMQGLYH